MNEIKCTECSREFSTLQGMRMHRSRAHKEPGPADDLFDLVGQATALLFPNAPPSRYIEIGEWQKATLRLLARK